jgi:uroporphyrinogen-III synthase
MKLQGKHIFITRPKHQAMPIVEQLQANGAIPHLFPLLDIVPKTPAMTDVTADYLIFISPNAVSFGIKALNWTSSTSIAAIGKKTANTLQQQHIHVEHFPSEGFDTEHFLALPAFQQVEGKTVVIVRGEGGRELLAQTLKERGAEVTYAEVYIRRLPELDISRLKKHWLQQQLDIIIITSVESLQNLYQETSRQSKDVSWLSQIPLILGSERMLSTANRLGHQGRKWLADNPSDEAVMALLQRL